MQYRFLLFNMFIVMVLPSITVPFIMKPNAMGDDVRILYMFQRLYREIVFIGKKKPSFVIKQYADENPAKQYNLVRELLSTYAARKIGLHVATMYIIPPGVSCLGKRNTEYAAVLYAFIAGLVVRELGRGRGRLKIKQWASPTMPKSEWGLTRSIIRAMVNEPGLIPMVAFDTFFGNIDRSSSNIVLGEDGQYWAIDSERILRADLSAFARDNLEKMYQERPFNHHERRALVQYYNVLVHIQKNVSLEWLTNVLDRCFSLCFIHKGSRLVHLNEKHKQLLMHAYQSAKKLIKYLGELLKK
jgi:hypothetical protein